jgi:Kdo2-lipid IVA lauroyltransferase/acyltransferase
MRGRIKVIGVERFIDVLENPRPRIFFTAHMGNFELLPIAAATYNLDITAMFRPPNNPYVAAKVLGARRTNMGHLVPSKAGAAISLARILEKGGSVGVLVDQKFARGLPTSFFNAPCLTNPLLGKLARQFECEVRPAFCVRLPDGRFQLTLEEPLSIPRNAKGKVDEHALMQAINDHVEGWIRTYPGQWMWFHKRWQMPKMTR